MESNKNLKSAVMDIKNGIDVLSQKSSLDLGRTVRTTINRKDDSYYIYGISEDGDLEYELSSETCETIENYLQKLRERTRVLGFNGELEESYSKVTLDRENRTTLYVSINYDIKLASCEVFEKYTEELLSSISGDSEHVNINKLSVNGSRISPLGYDATLVYDTDEPENIYANVESPEEYADKRAQNSEKSKEEILNKNMYTTHCHPQDKKELLKSIESEVWDMVDFELESANGFEIDPVRYVISDSFTEMEIAVRESYTLD